MATGRAKKSAKDTDRIYCGRLIKLYRRRWRNRFLPNTAEGRAMLIALLHFGLSPEAAVQLMSWRFEAAELRQLQRRTRSVKRSELGRMIKLTYEEREQERVWSLMPYDVSNEEFQLRQTVKKEVNNKRRQQQKRDKEREERMRLENTISREDAILAMLSDSRYWTPISALVKQAETCKAFRRPDGKQVGLSWDYPRRERFGSMGNSCVSRFFRQPAQGGPSRGAAVGGARRSPDRAARRRARQGPLRAEKVPQARPESQGGVTGFVTVTV